MPEFFRSTAKKPGMTKVRKGYKSGSLTKVSDYKPVLGNNKFGYPSGGVPVRSFRGGGAAQRGLGKALTKK